MASVSTRQSRGELWRWFYARVCACMIAAKIGPSDFPRLPRMSIGRARQPGCALACIIIIIIIFIIIIITIFIIIRVHQDRGKRLLRQRQAHEAGRDIRDRWVEATSSPLSSSYRRPSTSPAAHQYPCRRPAPRACMPAASGALEARVASKRLPARAAR